MKCGCRSPGDPFQLRGRRRQIQRRVEAPREAGGEDGGVSVDDLRQRNQDAGGVSYGKEAGKPTHPRFEFSVGHRLPVRDGDARRVALRGLQEAVDRIRMAVCDRCRRWQGQDRTHPKGQAGAAGRPPASGASHLASAPKKASTKPQIAWTCSNRRGCDGLPGSVPQAIAEAEVDYGSAPIRRACALRSQGRSFLRLPASACVSCTGSAGGGTRAASADRRARVRVSEQ